MRAVATSGAVPLNSVNATLKTSATPVKRIRVGNRSVSSTAKVPLTSPATSAAISIAGTRPTVRAASAP